MTIIDHCIIFVVRVLCRHNIEHHFVDLGFIRTGENKTSASIGLTYYFSVSKNIRAIIGVQTLKHNAKYSLLSYSFNVSLEIIL